MQVQDENVTPAIEAGAKALFGTSPGWWSDVDHGWKNATPHIRNRWRRRFITALAAYNDRRAEDAHKVL